MVDFFQEWVIKIFMISGVLCFTCVMLYLTNVAVRHEQRTIILERIVQVLLYIFVGFGGLTLLTIT